MARKIGSPTKFFASSAETFKTLVHFDGTDGVDPVASLIQAIDGHYYGTTYGSGGTVFKVTPSGKLTTLYSFCSLPKCADSADPWAPLVQGADRTFTERPKMAGSMAKAAMGVVVPSSGSLQQAS